MDLNIAPLKCRNCGSDLPARGQFITFQCPSCKRHWLLADDGLEPLKVKRAIDKPHTDNSIFLPFWIVPVDIERAAEDLASRIDEVTMNVKSAAQMMKIGNSREELSDTEGTAIEIEAGRKHGVFNERGRMLSHVTSHVSSIMRSELNSLIKKLTSFDRFSVFVPAFLSPNPYAYIKVGRLMTSHQVRFEATETTGESSILCALRESSALKLVDFIFISTLPEKVHREGRLLEKLHLEPTGRATLVEFPFVMEKSYLRSIHIGFSVSRRLITLEEGTTAIQSV